MTVRTLVWDSDHGYIVPKTNELEIEVMKILKLWDESDRLTGYCPYEREQKIHEYWSPSFEIETVSEHTGVVFISLYAKG